MSEYVKNSILKNRSNVHILTSTATDAFDNSDCTDALLQIRRYPLIWFHGHPLTILRIPFDKSADSLDDAVDKLWITHVVNPEIS